MTRLYYFVYANGALVHPSLVTAPDMEVVEIEVTQRLSSLVFYDGRLKIRYRFHFDLFIMGEVYDNDRVSLTLAMHDIWRDTVKGIELISNYS